jgi:hypothetical protein
MIHWTLLPEELILADSIEGGAVPTIHETIVDGVHLLVEHTDVGIKVVRLLSPDPMDFLDPRFQPGNVLFITQEQKG